MRIIGLPSVMARDGNHRHAIVGQTLRRMRGAYGRPGARERLTPPDAGHDEIPEMRRRVLDFLSRTIGTD